MSSASAKKGLGNPLQERNSLGGRIDKEVGRLFHSRASNKLGDLS